MQMAGPREPFKTVGMILSSSRIQVSSELAHTQQQQQLQARGIMRQSGAADAALQDRVVVVAGQATEGREGKGATPQLRVTRAAQPCLGKNP